MDGQAEKVEVDASVISTNNSHVPYFIEQQQHNDNNNKVIKHKNIIEKTMDWYDHVACAFLLFDDPLFALQKIKAIETNFKQGSNEWRSLLFSHLNKISGSDLAEKSNIIVQILSVLQQNKILKLIGENPVSASKIDPFRLRLFSIIDGLSKEEAAILINTMNFKVDIPCNDEHCAEYHFLGWIYHQEISDVDCSKLEDSIQSLKENSTPPALPLLSSNISKSTPIHESTYNLSIPPVICSSAPQFERSTKLTVHHGICIIINQMKFVIDHSLPHDILKNAKPNLSYRHGSDIDRDMLSESFRMLNFDVEIYQNLSVRELFSVVTKVSQYDFKNYDALVLCFLSHGDRNCIYSTDSIPISLDTIKKFFYGENCSSLYNKPKMFFLQACQGNENQGIVYRDHETDGIEASLPGFNNFFEAWATVPGFYSYRSPYKGSVFIRALCYVLQNYGQKETLLDMMTIVNNKVASWTSSDCKKQMSCCTYSLTQGVKFKIDEVALYDVIVDKLERELLDMAILAASRSFLDAEPMTELFESLLDLKDFK